MVCGGEHINACPEYCLKECPEIDICVIGEGEETSVDLLKNIEQKFKRLGADIYRKSD